jgi:hypothetical protein
MKEEDAIKFLKILIAHNHHFMVNESEFNTDEYNVLEFENRQIRGVILLLKTENKNES